jgi:hypothetical protein
MQFKFLTTIALATLAVAAPGGSPPNNGSGGGSSTNLCCEQVITNGDSLFGVIAGLLGIAVGDVIGAFGLDCTVDLLVLYCVICCLVSRLQTITVIGNPTTCGDSNTEVTCTSSQNTSMCLLHDSTAATFELLTFFLVLGVVNIGCIIL